MIADYLTVEKNNVFKTEAYYCNRYGQVKGHLLIMDPYLQFDPFKCDENNSLVSYF